MIFQKYLWKIFKCRKKKRKGVRKWIKLLKDINFVYFFHQWRDVNHDYFLFFFSSKNRSTVSSRFSPRMKEIPPKSLAFHDILDQRTGLHSTRFVQIFKAITRHGVCKIWPEITLLLSQSHKYGLSSNFTLKSLSLRKVENKRANFSNIEIFKTSSLIYIYTYTYLLICC